MILELFVYLLNTQIWVPIPTQHANLSTYSTIKFGWYMLSTQIWVLPPEHSNLGTYSILKFGYLLNTQIWVPVPTQHTNLGTGTYSTLHSEKFASLVVNCKTAWLLRGLSINA
jgi:hypothetical protein